LRLLEHPGVIEFVIGIARETWSILMEASVFLLFGFVLGGVLAVVIPQQLIQRLLGRGRVSSVLWASAIGVPLPLCSCGVLPAALRLSRQGATKGATVSFLISTPETDVDAIALTYGLMGPIFAVFRAVAGVVTAFVAGVTTNLFGERGGPPVVDAAADQGGSPATAGAAPVSELVRVPLPEGDHHQAVGILHRLRQVLQYAFGELLDEIAHWLILGIVVAAMVTVLLPPSIVERYLSGGLATMLLMLVIAIPIYTCASASTPVAAALILKGLDPGAALVFLLAGPATNIGAIIVLLKFLGHRVVAIYLASIAVVSVVAGYLLNWIFARWQLDPVAEIGAVSGLVPEPVKLASAVLLVALLLRSLSRTPVPDEWRRLGTALATMTGVRVTGRRLGLACAIFVVALYLGSGVFSVGIGETALKTRFGRIVGEPLAPGLHVRLPWPIESHRTVQQDQVRRLEVGFRSTPRVDTAERAFARQLTVAGPRHSVPPGGSVGFWYEKARMAEESFLVTGDENIIDVAFTVQYQVKDPVAYTFGVTDPDAIVRSATVAALRAIIARLTVDATYTSGRGEIEREAREQVQQTLDVYGTGVHVLGVNVLSVHAPEEVHAAFRDVASAQEDRILIIDRATTFAVEGVNLAEGEAAAMVESALAFKRQRVLQAEGEAHAFTLRERAYRRASDLTQFRLHLEALEEVLPATPKILRPGDKDLREFDLWLLEPPGVRRTP
jgi:HflK protein